MNEKESLQVVQKFFEATVKGNFPAVKDMLAENIDWQSPVTRIESKEISWSKPRHSPEEVSLFFKELFEKVQTESNDIHSS